MIHVAIDGPAGAGKSTIAKAVAQKLGIQYLDTGAMYRAVTAMAIDRGVDLEDAEKLETLALSLTKQGVRNSGVHAGATCSTLGLSDERLRREDVSTNVSKVATHTPVRRALVELQRWIATQQSLVIDGRDIGTVVLPQAQVKIYLDATPEERARRRSLQNGRPYESVLEDIIKRDRIDSTREDSPLRKAKDAHYIDSTSMSPEQVVDEIVSMVKQP